MTGFDCLSIRRHLAAYVDGELRGPNVLLVPQHLERCPECTAELNALREIGDTLRGAMPRDLDPHTFDGLASTIISRTKAETAQSWRGVLQRAQEDWHWVMIGAGSVTATFVSTLILSTILAFGPSPKRGDSLSALIVNSEDLAYAIPAGVDSEAMLMHVDEIGPMASRATVELARAVVEDPSTEAELVDALLSAVTYKGRSVTLDRMNAEDRRRTEGLLEDINRLRLLEPMPISLAVGGLQFEVRAFTSVSAKGL